MMSRRTEVAIGLTCLAAAIGSFVYINIDANDTKAETPPTTTEEVAS